MTAKYMRDNFKKVVSLLADEIRRVNGAHRVTPSFGEFRSKFNPEGGTVYGPQMAITGRDEGPEYVLTDEQLEKITHPIVKISDTPMDVHIPEGMNISINGLNITNLLNSETSGEK
jgi:hypothetical protein